MERELIIIKQEEVVGWLLMLGGNTRMANCEKSFFLFIIYCSWALLDWRIHYASLYTIGCCFFQSRKKKKKRKKVFASISKRGVSARYIPPTERREALKVCFSAL